MMTYKSEEVQSPISFLSSLQRLGDVGHSSKFLFSDGLIDSNDVLPHNAPGANVEMAIQSEGVCPSFTLGTGWENPKVNASSGEHIDTVDGRQGRNKIRSSYRKT